MRRLALAAALLLAVSCTSGAAAPPDVGGPPADTAAAPETAGADAPGPDAGALDAAATDAPAPPPDAARDAAPDTGPACWPPCDPERCRTCVDGACLSTCDPLACEECEAGTCVNACDDGSCANAWFCNQGTCEPCPCMPCDTNEFGYCAASVVRAIGVAAADAPGCDPDQDGVPNNALAALAPLLPAPSLDQRYAAGPGRVVLEHVGLEDAAASCWYSVNAYGAVPGDPEGREDGDSTWRIDPASLAALGEPLCELGAQVDAGAWEAGSFQVVVPLRDPDRVVTAETVVVRAEVAPHGAGYALSHGSLCGYIRQDQVFLMLAGADFAEAREAVAAALPGLLDVDSDGDDVPDSLSVHLTFDAVGAVIVGVAGEDRR